MMRRFAGLSLALMLAATVTAAAQSTVVDLDGRPVDPLGSADARAVVLLFVSVECPVSNRYAPEVGRLHARFETEGVRFWLVYPNPLETPDQIREHVRAFGYRADVARDPRQELAKKVGATITPEAAVFDRAKQRVYRGRVDDRYVSLGLERPAATRKDLEEALTSTLAGRRVEMPETAAVGCFIADFEHLH